MQLSNNFIYQTTIDLMDLFSNNEQYIPIKLNFAIQKNIQTFKSLFEGIDAARLKIGQQYGEMSESGFSIIDPEKQILANQELMDLGEIIQEVPVQTVKIESITDDIRLTPQQMQTIMFMIEG